MDVLSMLMNARITDTDGAEIGEVIGVHIAMGKMWVSIDMELDEEDGDPDDDGEKEDIPEDDASKQKFPKLAAALSEKPKKDGTNG